MFEKLTPRERKLAFAVLGLVPTALVFMVIFWFLGKYGDNEVEFQRLTTSISVEKDRMAKAAKANQRRVFFNSVSLPPELNAASNDYQVWLKMMIDELQMELKSVQPRDAGALKFEQEVLGYRKSFKVTTKGDLKQLTEFLARFYKVDLLHRINAIKVIPENEVAGKNKKVRSGKLSLVIDIEVLSLNEAENRDEFTNHFRELTRSDEEFQLAILKRNVFGPANNAPVASARPSSSYYSGSDVKIQITGKDLDENNLLGFELVDASSLEGEVELTQKEPGDKKAYLTIPGQKAGKYPVKVRIFDDGFPSKESFAEFNVVVKDKPPKAVVKKEVPPPPAPPYKNANQTKITGVVKDISGVREVWMKVRTTGKKYRVKAGESFELDDRTWSVQAVEADKIIIEVDDKVMTFFDGDFLNAPREEKAVASPAAKLQPNSDLPPLPQVVGQ